MIITKIRREELYNDGSIVAACMMADDAECHLDIRDVACGLVTTPIQTHTMNVGIVEHYGCEYRDTDALLCFRRGIPVGVVTADYVPILVHAPDIGGVGAIHAGWRGTLGGIVDNVLDAFEERGADLSLLQVFFGPSISVVNYEVNEDLACRFRSAGFSAYVISSGEGERPHIDLQGINQYRFIRRGVPAANIRLHSGCTYGSLAPDNTYLYQSHRRSQGSAGRMLSYITLL